jgi:elongation factor P
LKVIASSLRKGNVVEMEGRLYVVLTASNFHPGKGTPTTSVDMRRISDGTKVSERWRTTEMVEKATVDEREYDFLYEDGEGFHFMDPISYDQVVVTEDVLGANKVYLQESMRCYVKTFDGVPIAMEVPQKITVDPGDRACHQGADGLVFLQAGSRPERPSGDGAAAYRARRADRDQHGRRQLCRARQGLSCRAWLWVQSVQSVGSGRFETGKLWKARRRACLFALRGAAKGYASGEWGGSDARGP